MNVPSRRSQLVLHPQKEDGALWFGIDPEVNRTKQKAGGVESAFTELVSSNSTPQTSPNLAAESVTREQVNREEEDAQKKEDDGEVGHVPAGEVDGEDDGYEVDEDDDNKGCWVRKTLF
ncbi:unnamed protein product [Cochlearia groenlandica]